MGMNPSYITNIKVLMLLQDENLSLEQLMSRLGMSKQAIGRAVRRLEVRKLIQFNQTDHVYELIKN